MSDMLWVVRWCCYGRSFGCIAAREIRAEDERFWLPEGVDPDAMDPFRLKGMPGDRGVYDDLVRASSKEEARAKMEARVRRALEVV
jgi:hypothetical protein